MAKVYLSTPGIVSALGYGVEETLAALFSDTPTLVCESGWMGDTSRSITVGKVELAFSLPAETPVWLQSRNNALLEHALRQIDSSLQGVVAQYGSSRVAVVMGTSTSGSDENEAAFRRVIDGVAWAQSGYKQEKQQLASPAEYTAWRYGLTAPCYSVSTACTSGAKVLISAARLLRSGVVDAVVCGGVDTLSRFTLNGFDSLSVLSSAPCQPFSVNRDGINIGEGAAVFIATREPIDGCVCLSGYGIGSDAYHMSTPRPDGTGAIAVMQEALRRSQCDAAEVGWINAHGTGTEANDAMEAKAIGALFGTHVPVTSTKSRTGHCLGAAGAIEAALACLVADPRYNPEGRVPAQGYALDPELASITLAGTDAFLAGGQRRVLSNSFAFGGSNAALMIEVDDDN